MEEGVERHGDNLKPLMRKYLTFGNEDILLYTRKNDLSVRSCKVHSILLVLVAASPVPPSPSI